jgi:hypothetical protein
MREYLAVGPRKTDWEMGMRISPEARILVEALEIEMLTFHCDQCGHELVMEAEKAHLAFERGWPKICVNCLLGE